MKQTAPVTTKVQLASPSRCIIVKKYFRFWLNNKPNSIRHHYFSTFLLWFTVMGKNLNQFHYKCCGQIWTFCLEKGPVHPLESTQKGSFNTVEFKASKDRKTASDRSLFLPFSATKSLATTVERLWSRSPNILKMVRFSIGDRRPEGWFWRRPILRLFFIQSKVFCKILRTLFLIFLIFIFARILITKILILL